MILYLDTSALVKKYFREPGSDEVIFEWKRSMAVATSSIAYAEASASFHRKKREAKIKPTVFGKILRNFHDDWSSFICVEVNNEINAKIDTLVERHPLRGFDAIHLASALILHETASEEFLFGCYDQRLLKAAASEGLKTLPSI
jgi:predicted nucleic acid-binding protein